MQRRAEGERKNRVGEEWGRERQRERVPRQGEKDVRDDGGGGQREREMGYGRVTRKERQRRRR